MDITALNTALDSAVIGGVPGVIAGVTNERETEYLAAAGLRAAGGTEAARTDAVFALYSATKAVTATAALQCIEDGVVDPMRPAADYLPEIGRLQVVEEVDADGTAHTRPPRTPITVEHLLSHTSGLGYDMFDERLAALARIRMRSGERTTALEGLRTPLLHDPGDQWTYGISMDWLGLLVQEVRGSRLDDVFRERIFAPCGMSSTSFDVSADMRTRLAPAHRRRSDGTLRVSPAEPPTHAEFDFGGQGLFSTVPDYLAFLRVWLGDGSAPHGRVLSPETVGAARTGSAGVPIRPLVSAIPSLTQSVEFYPDLPTSWATAFLRVDADVPGRRRAGSLSWAGLANVHYWIDPASGIAAMWTAQLLPWFDPAAERGLDDFEAAVYA